jgi:hypothetical protein
MDYKLFLNFEIRNLKVFYVSVVCQDLETNAGQFMRLELYLVLERKVNQFNPPHHCLCGNQTGKIYANKS